MKRSSRIRLFLATVVSLVGMVSSPLASAANSKYFGDWPAGSSPTEVGKRVTENYLQRDYLLSRVGTVVYPEVCVWYGALTYAQLAGNKELQEKLTRRFDLFLTKEGAAKISWKDHVDFRVFGIVPLEIALQTGSEKHKELGLKLADAQWAQPTPDGLSHEARYWIDDMYMLPVIQMQAWRATKEVKYLNRTADCMVAYLDKLQQPNGLFFHAPDSPFYWGRGNGWFAAGMAELLLELPATHPRYARVMEGYRKMMGSLLAMQSPEGLWRQLVDKPESWVESSGSAMFAFAFVTGVKRGWLPEESYGPAARKAWLSLAALLDEKNNLREVCVGTNKGAKEVGPDLKTQYDFYMARKREAGDRHGQAPMLWTASALLRP